MAVTTMILKSEAEYDALKQIAAGLDLIRMDGEREVGNVPELVRRLSDQAPALIAEALKPLMDAELPDGKSRPIRVAGISESQNRSLTEIARRCGCIQTRGAGAGHIGNRSILLRKMAQNPDAVIDALNALDIQWLEGIEYEGTTYRTYQEMAEKLGVSRQWAYQLVNQ